MTCSQDRRDETRRDGKNGAEGLEERLSYRGSREAIMSSEGWEKAGKNGRQTWKTMSESRRKS